MKQIITFVQAIAHKMHSAISFTNSKMIFANQLPLSVKLFVQNHFRGKSIASAEQYNEVDGKTYEVNLNDGTTVCFDNNGSWNIIQCQSETIPMVAVPIAISLFVKSHCPENMKVRIDKMNEGYAVLLSNREKYTFNKNGLISGYCA